MTATGIFAPRTLRKEKKTILHLVLPRMTVKERRHRIGTLAFGVIRTATLINVLVLVVTILYIAVNGYSAISWGFLSEAPKNMMTEGGIWPCLVGTFLLSTGAMVIALPLGVATAIWLHEYARDGVIKKLIRLSVANLAGIPSVVFGLFGMAFFVVFCKMGVSLLAGVLTLGLLTLPTVINTVEEALSQVPDTWRESSYALGATKSQTIWRVVIPAAAPGLLTGMILALARAAGETSAIMFTAAVVSSTQMPNSVFSSVMALPYHMYVLATTGSSAESVVSLQFGTALVLLLLVAVMNLVAIVLRERLRSKLKSH